MTTATTTAPKKIFIVDDDPMFTEQLRDYITRSIPHNILSFSLGEDCLKSLNEKPDVIILDYFLDSKDAEAANGIEVLEVIKKHFPNIRVIMLSSQTTYKVNVESLQKGAKYVIKDEFAFEKILKLVNAN
jgi:DNA-binding NarL/FixJ family response regulator